MGIVPVGIVISRGAFMNIVKELRKKHNIQQKELASIIGVAQPTISEWETGKKDPSGERLQKLAEFFQVDELDILGRGMYVKERTPITNEARIVSGGIDKLSQEQREQVLNVFKAMFPCVFKNEGNE